MRFVHGFIKFYNRLRDGDTQAYILTWIFLSAFVAEAIVIGLIWWHERINNSNWTEWRREKERRKTGIKDRM